MPAIRKSLTATVVLGCGLLAIAGVSLAFLRTRQSEPAGKAPPPKPASVAMPQLERQKYLEGEFTIIKDVKALPQPVLKAFVEAADSRKPMANPGEKYQETDFASDSSLPWRRLVFAGISGDKCFVHYEKGGYAHIRILAFFRVNSPSSVETLWRGFCGAPAANMQDLRSRVMKGECSQPVPQNMK